MDRATSSSSRPAERARPGGRPAPGRRQHRERSVGRHGQQVPRGRPGDRAVPAPGRSRRPAGRGVDRVVDRRAAVGPAGRLHVDQVRPVPAEQVIGQRLGGQVREQDPAARAARADSRSAACPAAEARSSSTDSLPRFSPAQYRLRAVRRQPAARVRRAAHPVDPGAPRPGAAPARGRNGHEAAQLDDLQASQRTRRADSRSHRWEGSPGPPRPGAFLRPGCPAQDIAAPAPGLRRAGNLAVRQRGTRPLRPEPSPRPVWCSPREPDGTSP